MRNYIILNNKNSNTISGLIIQELAPISKPLQRTQVETIDGRDGDIVTPLGYAAYNKKIKIGLYGDFDINEIIAYFATQGTAIFSNEPDKYYNYQILDQIDYERLVRFRVATVTMHVQPFKYSATEQPITVDVSGQAISGEGNNIVLENTAEAPFNVLRHKGNATQKTYTGKNLLPVPSPYINTGIKSYNIALPAGTYTLSFAGATTTGSGHASYFRVYDDQNTDLATRTVDFSIPNKWTFTIASPATKFAIYSQNTYAGSSGVTTTFTDIQLEAGSAKSDYEPYVGGTASPNPDYPQDIKLLTGDSTITIDDGGDNSQEYVIPFGDTYLAAIGDYADEPVKVDGTWYIRRAIGKVVLDGSESWWIANGTLYTARITDYATTGNTPISGYFTGQSNILGAGDVADNRIAFNNSTQYNYRFYIRCTSKFASVSDLTTWLGAHPTTVYYALATPTDEEITDQALIDALDDFYEQAHGYKGRTHITASAQGDNAPAILAVEVNQDNETTVTNAGNTTSRPIITIYGQGNIGMYINDVQVLDIALGDEQYITIDSVAMEAYKDTTENLKNRLVTGDYNKLALNAGANKIYFTGNVTKYEISKYSRWL